MKLLLAALAAIFLNFLAPGGAVAQTGLTVTGKVAEVKEVPEYTYMRLTLADGEVWAAVTRAPVKPGATVTVVNAMVMSNFESKTLNRKFDRVLFGSLGKTPDGAKLSSASALAAPAAAGPGAAAGAPPAGMPSAGAPHGSGAATAPAAPDVKVAKATGPNARTVAEVVTKRTELKGKPVVVRGKVVKFNSNIMGKNWVHLRDGSGSEKDQTNDVLVTTKDQVKLGDVVVASGTVRTDVELGAGYSYSVLIEDAKLAK